MRDYFLVMPASFKNGQIYMQKMEEMTKLEFEDVHDTRLFQFELPEFFKDKKQKDLPSSFQDSWICNVQTHFLFAYDSNCR